MHQKALWVPEIWKWRAEHDEGQILQIVESALRKETRIDDLTTGTGWQFGESIPEAAEKVYTITWKFGRRLYMDTSRPLSTSAVGESRTFAIENLTGQYPVIDEEGPELNDLVAVGESFFGRERFG